MRWHEVISLAKDVFDVHAVGGVLAALGFIALVIFGKPLSQAFGKWMNEKAPALGVFIAIAMVVLIVIWVISIIP